MPVKGIVFVTTDPRKTQQCLSSLPGNVQAVSGRFDAVLTIQSETPKELINFVLGKIRTVEGVTNTETLITVKEFTRTPAGNAPVKAAVLINTNATKTNSVFQTISTLPETSACAIVTGHCDIVCTLNTATLEKLSETLLNSIRTIDGIISTETLIATT